MPHAAAGQLRALPGQRSRPKQAPTAPVLFFSSPPLPPLQVQQCLPELLKLCQAEHALPAVRSGGPVKLSVDLTVVDEAGRTWVLLMKTWQNVVSGEHRPTFVLENTGGPGTRKALKASPRGGATAAGANAPPRRGCPAFFL